MRRIPAFTASVIALAIAGHAHAQAAQDGTTPANGQNGAAAGTAQSTAGSPAEAPDQAGDATAADDGSEIVVTGTPEDIAKVTS